MKAREAIIRVLRSEDVDTLFTLLSGDSMGLLAEIEDEWSDEIRTIHSRHEQGAMAMADGYARASNGISVCIVGRGPAIAQTGTSLVTAKKRGSKLLVLVPGSPVSARHDTKGFKQEAYLESTIEKTIIVQSSETLVPAIQDAFRRLHAGDGPLVVQVPMDLFDADVPNPERLEEDRLADTKDAVRPSGRHHPAPGQISAAIDVFLDSDAFELPIILAGRGAVQSDAKDALEELAEKTSGLLATTLQARGYFADHPYSVGFVGNFGKNLANEYLTEADCIFAFGCSLNSHTTDSGHLIGEDAKIIHVDTNPANIDRFRRVDLGIVGDTRETATAISRELTEQQLDRDGELWTDSIRDHIAETSPLDDREFPAQDGRIDPRDVVRTLDRVVPEDRLVVTDGGHFVRWVLDGIEVTDPLDYIWTLDFGSIGQGLPIGIGAAEATDRRMCVTVCGDAGFMMVLQEVETAARNEIPLLIVVLNDDALGVEYHSLNNTGEYPDVALSETPDLAGVADKLGATGHTIRSPSDIEELSEELGTRPDGPIVLDCKVNRNVIHRSKL